MEKLQERIKIDLKIVKEALSGEENPQARDAAERLMEVYLENPDYFSSADEKTLEKAFEDYGLI
jgi:hypothetical protein